MLSGKHSAHIVKIIMKNIDLYNYFKNENIFKDSLSLDIFPIYSKNDIVAVQLEYENEYFYIEYEIRCNKYQNGKYDINIYFMNHRKEMEFGINFRSMRNIISIINFTNKLIYLIYRRKIKRI